MAWELTPWKPFRELTPFRDFERMRRDMDRSLGLLLRGRTKKGRRSEGVASLSRCRRDE